MVPINYWRRVIFEYHDSPDAGHPGRDETTRAVARLYYWPAMKRQIKTYVKHCIVCASVKRGGATQTRAPLRLRPPRRPWQTISVDVMGPYPKTRSGNKFIVVAMDVSSKWTEAVAVPDARAKRLIEFVEQLCRRWGYPADIITDNGSDFRAATWARFLTRHDINHYTTPIYHQRSNPVERRNQELKKLLRVHQRNRENDRWDESLEQILFTLRTRTNAAAGMAPSEVLLGAPLVRAGEWRHPEVNRNIENNARVRDDRLAKVRRRQEVFDCRLYAQPRAASIHFRVGDLVLVRNFPEHGTPHGPTWTGPHPVIAVNGDNTYEVDRNGAQVKIHVDDVRPWEDEPQFQAPLEDPLCRAEPLIRDDDATSMSGEDARKLPVLATTVPIAAPNATEGATGLLELDQRPTRRTNVSPADIPVSDPNNATDETSRTRMLKPKACPTPAADAAGARPGPSGLCGSGARRQTWSSEDSSETPDDETRRLFRRFPPVTIEDCPDDMEMVSISPDAVPVVGLYP